MLHPDFFDMLSMLSDHDVDFLLVGAHAMAAHGLVRATGDIDIWLRPSQENAQRVWRALEEFGAPLHALDPADLTIPGTVFQIGVAPIRIDLLTEISGVDFAEAWARCGHVELEGLRIPILAREDLVRNKRATGRPKDLADVAWLESEDPAS